MSIIFGRKEDNTAEENRHTFGFTLSFLKRTELAYIYTIYPHRPRL